MREALAPLALPVFAPVSPVWPVLHVRAGLSPAVKSLACGLARL